MRQIDFCGLSYSLVFFMEFVTTAFNFGDMSLKEDLKLPRSPSPLHSSSCGLVISNTISNTSGRSSALF